MRAHTSGKLWVRTDCPSGKKGYVEKASAKDALKFLRRDRSAFEGKFNVYSCAECGYFHIGHMPDWKRQGLPRPDGYGVSQSETDTASD